MWYISKVTFWGKPCNIFSHDLEGGSRFITLSDDIRLGGASGTRESRVKVQSDPEKLESSSR